LKNIVAKQQDVVALGLGILPEHRQAAHALLGNALAGGTRGRLIGRIANVEGVVARRFAAGQPYDPVRKLASLNAGISPPTDAVLDGFSQRYRDAMRAADLMTLPFYPNWLDWMTESKTLVADGTPWFSYDVLRHPFGEDDPAKHWIRGLDGRRVLVVSPLRQSIERQLDNLDAVYGNLPGLRPAWASVTVVEAPMTQWDSETPGAPQPNKTWTGHFTDLTREMARHADDFDVCLLGCGGYGMPVAHFVKTELDRTALVFGGALQLLFGIRGARWDQREPVSKWFTDAWIRPAPAERPDDWQKIEGGCYW
jgi:hypothetical protein